MIYILATLVLGAVSVFIYRWYDQHYNYWKHKNLPHIPATSIFGNIKDVVLYRKSPADVFRALYNNKKTKDEPIVGVQFCHEPALIVQDPEIIKRILVKDFNYFANRYASSDPHSDSLGSYNLFFVNNPIWKQIRNHISPIFTSGKMKQFFLLVHNVAKNLDKYLMDHTLQSNPICRDIKEVCALYTTDVIASVAYGIEANSINNPESEFRKNGRHIFNFTPWRAFEFTAFFFVPKLVSIFKCKVFSAKSTKFLRSTFHYIIGERMKTKQVRNDLIDLLIGMRETTKLNINNKEVAFDGDLLVSQAAIFFTAGYETTSSTMSFGLYELAKNMEVQTRLREEIKEVLEEHKGEITYDIILNMKYLNMVLQEILRLYPPLPFLDRICELPESERKGYSLEPVVDFAIPNKTPVIIPIYALHRDEKYFPDPESFIPERFAPENKDNINPYAYLPFGTGGRVCIGERFGLMQARLGLFYFLKNHYVKMSSKTPKKMQLEKKALIIQSEGGIYLDIVRDPLTK